MDANINITAKIIKMKSKTSDQKSSLFVGRWQPFHKGHKTLIETVLKKGKPVVIAIRDTEISHKNPYTAGERWTMIQDALNKYGSLVKIVVIPDIDEICYGREVGYEIRKIELDDKLEKISGTQTRLKNPPTKEIIWLTGQSGAGKSTLANALQKKIGGVILDGDEMRETISEGLGFSKEDRHTHNLRVARLAQTLAKKNLVIVSVIAPFIDTREEINKLIKPVWVYVDKKLPKDSSKPYEEPQKPDIRVEPDKQSTTKQVKAVLKFLKKL